MISDLLILQYPKWWPEIMENFPKCHAPAVQHGVQVVGVPDMQLAEQNAKEGLGELLRSRPIKSLSGSAGRQGYAKNHQP